MTVKEAITIMCQRCLNHHMCMGTGCDPKKTLEEAIIGPRPKGKWIRGKIDNKDVWYCSNCKHIDDYYGPTANYCWYCGADMRGN